MMPAILGNVGELHPTGNYLTDYKILACWRSGMDTLEIARVHGKPESYIYNRLPQLGSR